jgi:hypothetical protein
MIESPGQILQVRQLQDNGMNEQKPNGLLGEPQVMV